VGGLCIIIRRGLVAGRPLVFCAKSDENIKL